MKIIFQPLVKKIINIYQMFPLLFLIQNYTFPISCYKYSKKIIQKINHKIFYFSINKIIRYSVFVNNNYDENYF